MHPITYLNIFFAVINLAMAIYCEYDTPGFWLNMFASALNAVMAADAIGNM
jgi:uncharacterized membrane protein